MTAEEVKKLLLQEIGTAWNRSNAHGVDLHRCLVDPPRRRTYLNSFDADAPVELWLVMEEDPETHRGYEIVFGEAGEYGLAMTQTQDKPLFLGWYGAFLETLENM